MRSTAPVMLFRMSYLPTLYKARKVPTKQAVCAICVERTRGKSELVRLGYGVTVWLCQAHASTQFQRQHAGRDFVLTLRRLWHAPGCLTAARSKALDAHLNALHGRAARPRPGSYAWPALRRQAEALFSHGAHPALVAAQIHHHYAACPALPPSRRSVLRWHAERRWLASAVPQPP
jgi:hypothetical protein